MVHLCSAARSFEPPQSVLQLDAATAMNGPQEKLRGVRDAVYRVHVVVLVIDIAVIILLVFSC